MKKRKKNFKNSKNSLNKLSLFQKSDSRFSRKCPFSVKNAPIIDYKNISLLQKYITETNKIITSKISNVSLGKQKKLAREIKKAKILGILQNNMQVILLENISKLGKIGDLVKVKNGDARNFQLKRNKALRANKENNELVNKNKSEITKKNTEIKNKFIEKDQFQ